MQLRVLERVGRIRWIFLPVGMCALTAVGAHAAADVVGDRVLWCVDRVDAFFDAIFASWSVTAPLVDLVGLSQRTFFARAVALIWELVADALIAVPLLGYQERDPAVELQAARILLRKKPTPPRLVRPLATLLCSWGAGDDRRAGGVLRTAGAWFFRTGSAAGPLLAYYSAGVYQPRPEPPPLLAAPVPPAQVLGYGAWAEFSESDEKRGSP